MLFSMSLHGGVCAFCVMAAILGWRPLLLLSAVCGALMSLDSTLVSYAMTWSTSRVGSLLRAECAQLLQGSRASSIVAFVDRELQELAEGLLQCRAGLGVHAAAISLWDCQSMLQEIELSHI